MFFARPAAFWFPRNGREKAQKSQKGESDFVRFVHFGGEPFQLRWRGYPIDSTNYYTWCIGLFDPPTSI